jgi:hypothetical protein
MIFGVAAIMIFFRFCTKDTNPAPPPAQVIHPQNSFSNQRQTTGRSTVNSLPAITLNLDHLFDPNDNLYYCTLHEKYFGYNERQSYYNCVDAIKNPNTMFCWECQEHYGADRYMYHLFHGHSGPLDSQKQYFQKYYCSVCGFDHYDNKSTRAVNSRVGRGTASLPRDSTNTRRNIRAPSWAWGTWHNEHGNFTIEITSTQLSITSTQLPDVYVFDCTGIDGGIVFFDANFDIAVSKTRLQNEIYFSLYDYKTEKFDGYFFHR